MTENVYESEKRDIYTFWGLMTEKYFSMGVCFLRKIFNISFNLIWEIKMWIKINYTIVLLFLFQIILNGEEKKLTFPSKGYIELNYAHGCKLTSFYFFKIKIKNNMLGEIEYLEFPFYYPLTKFPPKLLRGIIPKDKLKLFWKKFMAIKLNRLKDNYNGWHSSSNHPGIIKVEYCGYKGNKVHKNIFIMRFPKFDEMFEMSIGDKSMQPLLEICELVEEQKKYAFNICSTEEMVSLLQDLYNVNKNTYIKDYIERILFLLDAQLDLKERNPRRYNWLQKIYMRIKRTLLLFWEYAY